MKVSEWARQHPRQPATVDPDSTLEQLTASFLSHDALRDIYIVSLQGRIVGHIRHLRLAQILLSEHLPVQSHRQILERIHRGCAGELMETEFVFAHPDEELDNVLHRMLEYETEDIPILDNAHRIVGNINLTDVLKAVHSGEL